MRILGGFTAGAPGNRAPFNTDIAGGTPLRKVFPGAQLDIPYGIPGLPGTIQPGTKQKLKDIFPTRPGGIYSEPGSPGYEFDRKLPPAGLVQGAPGNLGALLAQAQPGFTPAPGFQNTDPSLDRFQSLLNQLEEAQRRKYPDPRFDTEF